MACKVYETTKLFNTSKSKQKQTRPFHIQLRKRHRTISFTDTDPLCLYSGDTDTKLELTPFKPDPVSEPVNPRDPLNLNSLHNNKKKKKTENNNNNSIKGKQIPNGYIHMNNVTIFRPRGDGNM